MSKFAYLIIASRKYVELQVLLKLLDYEDNDIYVHIDAKDQHPPIDELKKSVKYSNIYFIPRINVSWGGFSLIKCELMLLKAASNNWHYEYYHLLSGQDFPLYSQDYIHFFFEKESNFNFITPPKTNHDINKVRMRYEQYHFLQDKFIGKRRNLFKYIDFMSCYFQKIIGIRRFSDQTMAMSSQWFSIKDDLARFLVKNANELERKYRYTYCCDEIFLLSEILDTNFFQTLYPGGNLRFIRWKKFTKHDTSPRALNISDLSDLRMSGCLFARKMIFPESEELIDALRTNW